MGEELIKELIKGAPNVLVALAALYWTSRTIDKFIDFLLRLVDGLVELSRQNRMLERESNERKPEREGNGGDTAN